MLREVNPINLLILELDLNTLSILSKELQSVLVTRLPLLHINVFLQQIVLDSVVAVPECFQQDVDVKGIQNVVIE